MPPQLTSHLEPLQGRSSPTGVGFRRPEALEGGGQLEGPPPQLKGALQAGLGQSRTSSCCHTPRTSPATPQPGLTVAEPVHSLCGQGPSPGCDGGKIVSFARLLGLSLPPHQKFSLKPLPMLTELPPPSLPQGQPQA